ncbi:phosphotransferase system sugar-specific permease eiia type 1 [Lucifera butyrica]|uniref:Phosphotransferase system sugar-specific permease eiia type 1 n=1 Tax=Lucifera butyrica TaxID=1351585 RepID=A0A498R5J1_9FIRM|nr:glucose PTS transporter subunit IIA [Lucifera butyrica]VBB05463.1 phosphotransferase system sugar-specific permease eiia type 1 [Lucifera butyrica]
MTNETGDFSVPFIAPVDGPALALSQVPDPVFSRKMLGDGAAVEARGKTVYAPVDGWLEMIFPTNHAFGITTAAGLTVLVHIGVDTVELAGRGFTRLLEPGIRIKGGTPVIAIEPGVIASYGKSTATCVIITDMAPVAELNMTGQDILRGGRDILFVCTLKQIG